MSVTRATVRAAAKQLIQDAVGSGTGTPLLVTDPGDYNAAIAQALRMFDGDVPNKRIAHVTLATAAFRFALAGTGAILPPQRPAVPTCTVLGTPGSTTYSY